jgi:hypothetical protein
MIAAACHGRIREFTGNTSSFINDYRIFFGTFHKRFVAASEALENRRIPNATAVNGKRIVRESRKPVLGREKGQNSMLFS